ncbi:MAG: cytochrome P450 [Pseudomonadota bacterium]
MIPPKPAARSGRVSLWRYARLLRQDILSALPERLYRARMAEFRTPFFRSVLLNEPELVAEVLKGRPQDFPKSGRVTRGLRRLLGDAVFVTNGPEWQYQRRLIDPAFEGGRVDQTFPAMLAAVEAAVGRLEAGEIEVEAWASHLAADIIFRTLFSLPIEDALARRTYAAFRAFQRAQPVLRLLPTRRGRREARELRAIIGELVARRAAGIAAGEAPDDLATRIMTARDPETGRGFSEAEMVDQVSIFFLAGHETSAAALSWALYLLASHTDVQARAADEAVAVAAEPSLTALRGAGYLRDVFRETLRLYPPVPMMVREAAQPEQFRGRDLPKGLQVVISPWHLHRYGRIWPRPDSFEPERWQTAETRACARQAYLPFSAGPRVCPGAGFAMIEGTLARAVTLGNRRLEPGGPPPVPIAFLTVRSKNGIKLDLSKR